MIEIALVVTDPDGERRAAWSGKATITGGPATVHGPLEILLVENGRTVLRDADPRGARRG